LIIEPRHSTRTLLEMTLSHEGMQVYSAVTLSSALLQLRVLEPDLIIVALDHSGIEGSKAASQIRTLSASPLLALGDESGAPSGPEYADTVPYPFSAGQLCKKVARLLGC
jgi:DNA-binding response OmpR family regulator